MGNKASRYVFRCSTCGTEQAVEAGQADLHADPVARFACGHDLTQAQLREQVMGLAEKIGQDVFGSALKKRP